jgi:hypothetical protein
MMFSATVGSSSGLEFASEPPPIRGGFDSECRSNLLALTMESPIGKAVAAVRMGSR